MNISQSTTACATASRKVKTSDNANRRRRAKMDDRTRCRSVENSIQNEASASLAQRNQKIKAKEKKKKDNTSDNIVLKKISPRKPGLEHELQLRMKMSNEASPSKTSASGRTVCSPACEQHDSESDLTDNNEITIQTDEESDDPGNNVTRMCKKDDATDSKTKNATLGTECGKTISRKKGNGRGRRSKQLRRKTQRTLSKGRAAASRLRQAEEKVDESEWESASATDMETSEIKRHPQGCDANQLLGQECITSDGRLLIDEDGGEIGEHQIPMKHQLEKTIAVGSAKNNLSVSNVKKIIRSLVTHELVKEMLKTTLNASSKDLAPGSSVCEPKLTRSKMKEVLDKRKDPHLWPMSSIKLGHSAAAGPSILDVEFSDEDDDEDDEYKPSKDDVESDEESITSSQVSDLGSPFPFALGSPSIPRPSTPVTPATPTQSLLRTPTVTTPTPITPAGSGAAASQNAAFQMGPPLALPPSLNSTRQRLVFLSPEKSSDETEGDGIARRTRSKLPLTTTSLYDIEEAFIAPDITPDMYDTLIDDTDWQEFLDSLHKPGDSSSGAQNESMEVADEDDPEFNYIAEAETEVIEAEEVRFDGPFRISRKELNSLMEQLGDLFDEEDYSMIGLRTNLASAHENAAHFAKKAPSPAHPQNKEDSTQPSRVPRSHGKEQAEGEEASVFTSMVLEDQMQQLRQQMRQHIQLTTQMYVLTQGSEDFNHMAKDCKAMVKELDRFRSSSAVGEGSVYNVCNLPGAVEVVDSAVDWESHREEAATPTFASTQHLLGRPTLSASQKDSSQGTRRPALLDAQKEVLWKSSACVYPSLLPAMALGRHSKTYFTQGEDSLLILGREQFGHVRGQMYEMIHTYMMPSKTAKQISDRNCRKNKSKTGIFRAYRETGALPECPRTIEEFTAQPPCEQALSCLPRWCKGYQISLQAAKRKQEKKKKEELKKTAKRRKDASKTQSGATLCDNNPQDSSRKRRAAVMDEPSSEWESESEDDSESEPEGSSDESYRPLKRSRGTKAGTSRVTSTPKATTLTILQPPVSQPSSSSSNAKPSAIFTSQGIYIPIDLADPAKVNAALTQSGFTGVDEAGKHVNAAMEQLFRSRVFASGGGAGVSSDRLQSRNGSVAGSTVLTVEQTTPSEPSLDAAESQQSVKSVGQQGSVSKATVDTSEQSVNRIEQPVNTTEQPVKTNKQKTTKQSEITTEPSMDMTEQSVNTTEQPVNTTDQSEKTTQQSMKTAGQSVKTAGHSQKTTEQSQKNTEQSVISLLERYPNPSAQCERSQSRSSEDSISQLERNPSRSGEDRLAQSGRYQSQSSEETLARREHSPNLPAEEQRSQCERSPNQSAEEQFSQCEHSHNQPAEDQLSQCEHSPSMSAEDRLNQHDKQGQEDRVGETKSKAMEQTSSRSKLSLRHSKHSQYHVHSCDAAPASVRRSLQKHSAWLDKSLRPFQQEKQPQSPLPHRSGKVFHSTDCRESPGVQIDLCSSTVSSSSSAESLNDDYAGQRLRECNPKKMRSAVARTYAFCEESSANSEQIHSRKEDVVDNSKTKSSSVERRTADKTEPSSCEGNSNIVSENQNSSAHANRHLVSENQNAITQTNNRPHVSKKPSVPDTSQNRSQQLSLSSRTLDPNQAKSKSDLVYQFHINASRGQVKGKSSKENSRHGTLSPSKGDNSSHQFDLLQMAMKKILGSPCKGARPASDIIRTEEFESTGKTRVSLASLPSIVNTAPGVNITVNMLYSSDYITPPDPPSSHQSAAAEDPSSTTHEEGEAGGSQGHGHAQGQGDNSRGQGDNSRGQGDNSRGQGDNSRDQGDNSRGHGDVSRSCETSRQGFSQQSPLSDDAVSTTSDLGEPSDTAIDTVSSPRSRDGDVSRNAAAVLAVDPGSISVDSTELHASSCSTSRDPGTGGGQTRRASSNSSRSALADCSADCVSGDGERAGQPVICLVGGEGDDGQVSALSLPHPVSGGGGDNSGSSSLLTSVDRPGSSHSSRKGQGQGPVSPRSESGGSSGGGSGSGEGGNSSGGSGSSSLGLRPLQPTAVTAADCSTSANHLLAVDPSFEVSSSSPFKLQGRPGVRCEDLHGEDTIQFHIKGFESFFQATSSSCGGNSHGTSSHPQGSETIGSGTSENVLAGSSSTPFAFAADIQQQSSALVDAHAPPSENLESEHVLHSHVNDTTAESREEAVTGHGSHPSVTAGSDAKSNTSVTAGINVTSKPSLTAGINVTSNPSVASGIGVSSKPSLTAGINVTRNPSVASGIGVTSNPSVTAGISVVSNPSGTGVTSGGSPMSKPHSSWSGLSSVCSSADFGIVISVTVPTDEETSHAEKEEEESPYMGVESGSVSADDPRQTASLPVDFSQPNAQSAADCAQDVTEMTSRSAGNSRQLRSQSHAALEEAELEVPPPNPCQTKTAEKILPAKYQTILSSSEDVQSNLAGEGDSASFSEQHQTQSIQEISSPLLTLPPHTGSDHPKKTDQHLVNMPSVAQPVSKEAAGGSGIGSGSDISNRQALLELLSAADVRGDGQSPSRNEDRPSPGQQVAILSHLSAATREERGGEENVLQVQSRQSGFQSPTLSPRKISRIQAENEKSPPLAYSPGQISRIQAENEKSPPVGGCQGDRPSQALFDGSSTASALLPHSLPALISSSTADSEAGSDQNTFHGTSGNVSAVCPSVAGTQSIDEASLENPAKRRRLDTGPSLHPASNPSLLPASKSDPGSASPRAAQPTTMATPVVISPPSETPGAYTLRCAQEKTPTKTPPPAHTPSSSSSSSCSLPTLTPKPGPVVYLSPPSLPRRHRGSPKKQQLQKQVRSILPKGYTYELKLVSPTKAAARTLKRKATLFCQRSPSKPLLPKDPNTAQSCASGGGAPGPVAPFPRWTQRGMSLRNRAAKKKQPEAPPHKPTAPPHSHKGSEELSQEESEEETGSEREDWATLSQDDSQEEGGEVEDNDGGFLDNLMAASSTIGFNPFKKSDRHRSKQEIRKEEKLALLAPDVLETDPRKDEHDTACAQAYLNKVKVAMQKDPDTYLQFMDLVRQFEISQVSPVQVYDSLCGLLAPYPDLLEDFASFLLPAQALHTSCHVSNTLSNNIRAFLRKLELHYGKAEKYEKILRTLGKWDVKTRTPESLRHAVMPLLASMPRHMHADFLRFFPDLTPPDSHMEREDFEDVSFPAGGEGESAAGSAAPKSPDDFEDIRCLDENDRYRSKRCPCPCHHATKGNKPIHTHCYSCCLKVDQGQLYFQPSNVTTRRPVSATFLPPVLMPLPPDLPPTSSLSRVALPPSPAPHKAERKEEVEAEEEHKAEEKAAFEDMEEEEEEICDVEMESEEDEESDGIEADEEEEDDEDEEEQEEEEQEESDGIEQEEEQQQHEQQDHKKEKEEKEMKEEEEMDGDEETSMPTPSPRVVPSTQDAFPLSQSQPGLYAPSTNTLDILQQHKPSHTPSGTTPSPISTPTPTPIPTPQPAAPRETGQTQSQSATRSQSQPVTQLQNQSAARPHRQLTTGPQSQPETGPQSQPVTRPQSQPATIPQSQSAAEPQSQSAVMTHSQSVTRPQSQLPTITQSQPAAGPQGPFVSVTRPQSQLPMITHSQPAAGPQSPFASVTRPQSQPAVRPQSQPVISPQSQPATRPLSSPVQRLAVSGLDHFAALTAAPVAPPVILPGAVQHNQQMASAPMGNNSRMRKRILSMRPGCQVSAFLRPRPHPVVGADSTPNPGGTEPAPLVLGGASSSPSSSLSSSSSSPSPHPQSALLASQRIVLSNLEGGTLSVKGPDNTVIMYNSSSLSSPALSEAREPSPFFSSSSSPLNVPPHSIPSGTSATTRDVSRTTPSSSSSASSAAATARDNATDARVGVGREREGEEERAPLPTITSPHKSIQRGSFAGLLSQKSQPVGGVAVVPQSSGPFSASARLGAAGPFSAEKGRDREVGKSTSDREVGKSTSAREVGKSTSDREVGKSTSDREVGKSTSDRSAVLSPDRPVSSSSGSSTSVTWSKDHDRLVLEMVRDLGDSHNTYVQIAAKLQCASPQQVAERVLTLMELLSSSEDTDEASDAE